MSLLLRPFKLQEEEEDWTNQCWSHGKVGSALTFSYRLSIKTYKVLQNELFSVSFFPSKRNNLSAQVRNMINMKQLPGDLCIGCRSWISELAWLHVFSQEADFEMPV